jgi:hypothetical protein
MAHVKDGHNLLITADINKELGKKIQELKGEIFHEEFVHCC